jgi:hypothetical protein
MKKIKWTIMTLAILLSIGGAFATRPHYDCTFNAQYHLTNTGFVSAGTFGVDFICIESSNVCSYTLVNGQFVKCRAGDFVDLDTPAAKQPNN